MLVSSSQLLLPVLHADLLSTVVSLQHERLESPGGAAAHMVPVQVPEFAVAILIPFRVQSICHSTDSLFQRSVRQMSLRPLCLRQPEYLTPNAGSLSNDLNPRINRPFVQLRN